MVLYYAKIAMKLIIMSSAMLRDMLIRCTPLELAACLHLAEAYMHRDFYTYHCEPNHCRVSAVNAPSVHEISTIALALLVLSLYHRLACPAMGSQATTAMPDPDCYFYAGAPN